MAIKILMLILIAGCHCAKLVNFSLKGGYDSHINSTVGMHTKVDRDGWSLNGTSEIAAGASWNSKLGGTGYAGVGEKIIGVDATLNTDINNFARKRYQGEIGRNSNGTYLIGLQKELQLDNTLSANPQFQAATGDDARELVGLPQTSSNQNKNQQPEPKYETRYNPSMNNIYSYGVNPYAVNPYEVGPYGVNSYGGYPYTGNAYGTNYMANSYYGTIPNGPVVQVPSGYMANPYVSYVPYNSNGVPMNMYVGVPNNYMAVDQTQPATRPFIQQPNQQDQRHVKA